MASQTKQANSPMANNNQQVVRLLGKHVAREKAVVLFGVTMAVCALPILLGLRLWDDIPPLVQTGIIQFDGKDDSMPRPLLVFGVPGLLCLLNLIFHTQLHLNQMRMTMPPGFVRLMGRWGAPVLSTVFSTVAMCRSAGLEPDVMPCVLGLCLLLLGSHVMDCPQNALIALRFRFLERDPSLWKTTHRFAAYLWMLTGLGVLVVETLTGGLFFHIAMVVFVALLLPLVFGSVLTLKNKTSQH